MHIFLLLSARRSPHRVVHAQQRNTANDNCLHRGHVLFPSVLRRRSSRGSGEVNNIRNEVEL